MTPLSGRSEHRRVCFPVQRVRPAAPFQGARRQAGCQVLMGATLIALLGLPLSHPSGAIDDEEGGAPRSAIWRALRVGAAVRSPSPVSVLDELLPDAFLGGEDEPVGAATRPVLDDDAESDLDLDGAAL